VTEVDYKERLRIQRKNIIPKSQVMINSVSSGPKTLEQINRALILHDHMPRRSIKRFNTLLERLDIIRFPFMCSPDMLGDKSSWGWRYGLRELIETDFNGAPDDCKYINRTSWYLKQTLEDCFYNF